MTGEILKAVVNEACAFLAQRKGGKEPGTCMIEDDYKDDDQRTYIMPLILIDMMDATDTSQYPGGGTKLDWAFGMNSYAYMPDSYNDDPSSFSTDLLSVIDELRTHFSIGIWLVPPRATDDEPMAIADLLNNFAFVFTLSGLVRAKHLQRDGLVMGWRIVFDSISIDSSTDQLDYEGSVPLEGIDPVGYPWNNEE